MALMRFQGDVTGSLPKVLGGRFKVMEAEFDPETGVTLVNVEPLVDPLKAAGISD